MSRAAIHTTQAPAAIGPYSQAVEVSAGRILFLSGQIPIDPLTGQLVTGDIVAQTERVMQNLKALLLAADMSFNDVVRCGIFLTDFKVFREVNEVYGRYFPSNPPARATIQVQALPMGADVEIDAIAVK